MLFDTSNFSLYFCDYFNSFALQLETDSNILLKKADMALKKYKMNAVVANELMSRKEVVTVVMVSGKIAVYRDKTKPDADVECPLINLLVERHSAHIKDSKVDLSEQH